MLDTDDPGMNGPSDSPSEATTRAIEEALADLAGILKLPGILDFAEALYSVRRDYGAFWREAKTVQQMFQNGRLSKSDRDLLWSRFNELRDTARRLKDQEARAPESRSIQARETLLTHVREARTWIRGGSSGADMNQARLRLNQAMEILKSRSLSRAHHDECWHEWKEVRAELNFRRTELSQSEYEGLRSEISSIANEATYGDPYEAIRQIKSLQQRIGSAAISRDQRQWLRESLQLHWDKAQSRIEERREERERRHDEWRVRKEGALERLESLVAKNEGVIARLRPQIDDLEEKIRDAWNDEWADQAREWVREKYSKIEDIETTNASLEEKISAIRDELDE